MNASVTDVPLPDLYPAEWQILRDQPHNVLVEGSIVDTDAVVRLLQPHFREPVMDSPRQPGLDLPDDATGALILRDVAALNTDDQRRLSRWLDERGPGLQIISTSQRPLIALVASGLFDAALYYRLNVVLLQVGSRNMTELPDDDPAGLPQGIDSPTAVSTPTPQRA